MKISSHQQKKLILSALTIQHHAIKHIKTKYNLRQRDIEILSACYHFGGANGFFSLLEVINYMQDSYYHCSVHDTFALLTARGYLERLTKGRQWYKAHKYGVTYSGKAILNEYVKMVCKSMAGEVEDSIIY